jgi:hypothetical protein
MGEAINDAAKGRQLGIKAAGWPTRQHRDLRWDGRLVRVTTPVPVDVWAAVAAADPSTTVFQTPVWRDCVCTGTGWQDASRLYEMPGGRQLVLMMARRPGLPAGLAQQASWPAGWGSGGVLAPGGVRPGEVALVCTDLARGWALSTCVRPGFAAAPAWPAAAGSCSHVIPRTVHVAHLGQLFDDFWARSTSRQTRGNVRTARRHLQHMGITITDGNSPELLEAFYQVYLQWIDWRANRRKVPVSLARWLGRRAEPFPKFATVASMLGMDCRIWVAWWEGRPVGATISVYAGDTAVGWRCYADRWIPSRLRISEILMIESLRHACESGCRQLEMGESVGKASLAHLKERLGGEEHAFAEYCFERLPLSHGRMAIQWLRRRAEGWVGAQAYSDWAPSTPPTSGHMHPA